MPIPYHIQYQLPIAMMPFSSHPAYPAHGSPMAPASETNASGNPLLRTVRPQATQGKAPPKNSTGPILNDSQPMRPGIKCTGSPIASKRAFWGVGKNRETEVVSSSQKKSQKQSPGKGKSASQLKTPIPETKSSVVEEFLCSWRKQVLCSTSPIEMEYGSVVESTLRCCSSDENRVFSTAQTQIMRAAPKNAMLRFIEFPSSIYYRNNVLWCCLTLQKKFTVNFRCTYVQVCFLFRDMYVGPYSWPSIMELSFSSLSSSSLVVGESSPSLGTPPAARALPQPLTRMCLCTIC